MQTKYFSISIPYSVVQVIEIKEFENKRFVCKLRDRWERSIFYQGINLGFGITLFKTTYDKSSLLIFNWQQAIYTDGRGKSYTIDLFEISN